MEYNFKMLMNHNLSKTKVNIGSWDENAARSAIKFHKKIPAYQPTPLVSLQQLAGYLGIDKLYIKDESYRFGLNSFKALGASFAMGSIAEDWKDDKQHTFVTATDGNHGRGVAWMAKELNQKAVVYMPEGSSQRRLNHILAEGAEASITELNYDDAVRLAASKEKEKGWTLVQDTAWEGYEYIPSQIMKGYLTMGLEAYEEMQKEGNTPTHIFLQAGVGSMAAAMTAFFMNVCQKNPPKIIIVEPEKAACVFKSVKRGDGRTEAVTDKMDTMMAGLACGEPSIIAWPILRDYAEAYISCGDGYAASGMRILGAPLPGDNRVISGESGAVCLGVLTALMTSAELKQHRDTLKLGEDSKVLCFSTEGATDPDNYWDIVWAREDG